MNQNQGSAEKNWSEPIGAHFGPIRLEPRTGAHGNIAPDPQPRPKPHPKPTPKTNPREQDNFFYKIFKIKKCLRLRKFLRVQKYLRVSVIFA